MTLDGSFGSVPAAISARSEKPSPSLSAFVGDVLSMPTSSACGMPSLSESTARKAGMPSRSLACAEQGPNGPCSTASEIDVAENPGVGVLIVRRPVHVDVGGAFFSVGDSVGVGVDARIAVRIRHDTDVVDDARVADVMRLWPRLPCTRSPQARAPAAIRPKHRHDRLDALDCHSPRAGGYGHASPAADGGVLHACSRERRSLIGSPPPMSGFRAPSRRLDREQEHRVESVLGRGGMGVVFEARHTLSERRASR